MNGSSTVKRILVVVGDSDLRTHLRGALAEQGFEVTVVRNGATALEHADERPDGMIIDIGLPDADGADVARDAARQFGDRPTLYVSGWTPDFWQLSDAPGRWLVLQKPIPGRRLLKAVQWLSEGGDRKPDLD